jgi:hypothetical protein
MHVHRIQFQAPRHYEETSKTLRNAVKVSLRRAKDHYKCGVDICAYPTALQCRDLAFGHRYRAALSWHAGQSCTADQAALCQADHAQDAAVTRSVQDKLGAGCLCTYVYGCSV